MVTTIPVSEELLEKLKQRKFYQKESYEEVIWDLLEDHADLSDETKRVIEQSKKDFSENDTLSLEEVKTSLQK